MAVFQTVTYVACFIGIAVAVLDTLYPNEKFQKQIKMLFSLVFILSIAAPLIKGDIEFTDTAGSVSVNSDSYAEVTDNANNLFIKSIENNISMRISTVLNQNKIICKNIKTSINISDNNSISINEIRLTLEDSGQYKSAAEIINTEVGGDITVNLEE